MSDRGRLPRRWTLVLVAIWSVGGFVYHLVVLGTEPWLALAVCAGLAGLAVAGMRYLPVIPLRSAAPPAQPAPPAFDVDNAKPLELRDFAAGVRDRVSTWMGLGLGDGAREHAEKAHEVFDAILDLIDMAYRKGEMSGGALRQARLSMLLIARQTKQRPADAVDWYNLKKCVEEQRNAINDAVEEERQQSG